MTVAELKRLLDGCKDDETVKIRVVTTGNDTEPEFEEERERVPLDAHAQGWFECAGCSFTHTVEVFVVHE